jgi:hypothetical protein
VGSLSPAKIVADFEAGILTRLERQGLLLRALGQGAIQEFVDCVRGEALEDVLVAARQGPWTEEGWATTKVIGSWCVGEDHAEDTAALIRSETRAGVEVVRGHFGIECPS